MKYAEAVRMVKQGMYIPVNLRNAWRQASQRARTIYNPGRAGESFQSFARRENPAVVNTIRQQLNQIGLGDKLKALRYRGHVNEADATRTPLVPMDGKLVPRRWGEFYKPDISIRRVALDQAGMPAARAVDRSLATPGLKLYASAPAGSLGTRLITANSPVVDIYLNNKYLQKTRNGTPLVDLDAMLMPGEFRRQKNNTGLYTLPDRMFRMFTQRPTADDILDFGQVVRQGNGRVDDVGGLVFYTGQMNKDKLPVGHMFTTTMAESPFKRQAYIQPYKDQYRDVQNLRQNIDYLRRGFLSFVDPDKPYDDEAFMRGMRRGKHNKTYAADVSGTNLHIHPSDYKYSNPVDITRADREVWAGNYLKSRPPRKQVSFMDWLRGLWSRLAI